MDLTNLVFVDDSVSDHKNQAGANIIGNASEVSEEILISEDQQS